jgi:hypothetical protein
MENSSPQDESEAQAGQNPGLLKKIDNFFQETATNAGVVGEVLLFLWERKLWWLIPMVTVLLLFGLLLFSASSSGVAPFIYTLF